MSLNPLLTGPKTPRLLPCRTWRGQTRPDRSRVQRALLPSRPPEVKEAGARIVLCLSADFIATLH